MPAMLASWPRPHYSRTDSTAFLFYAAYGSFDLSAPLSQNDYRSNGPPEGFDLMAYQRDSQPDVLSRFCEGYVWDKFVKSDPGLTGEIRAAPGCIILRGELQDPPTLDYLRDTVGTVRYLFDCGAIAVYDPQILRWWSGAEWWKEVFDPAGPEPWKHAVILESEESTGLWIHTRGMRKFARPDISVHRVGATYRDAVVEVCARFIAYMALGGRPAEGEAIRMKSLPAGGVVRHGGDLDDPDFNNVHMELVWPRNRLADKANK